MVKKHLNPKLGIEGILISMVDGRTNYNREIGDLIRENYGKKIRIVGQAWKRREFPKGCASSRLRSSAQFTRGWILCLGMRALIWTICFSARTTQTKVSTANALNLKSTATAESQNLV